MTREEAFEVTALYSIAEGLPPNQTLMTERPFREVHHTASKISITGGGNKIRPGEITLAHKGILFMDEITEFPRSVLETLRQPLEDGFINISRASSVARFPCEFTLLAAMNNCPCGRLGNTSNTQTNKKHNRCACTPKQIAAYSNRLSGPILDRFDIFIETPKISISSFLKTEKEQKQDDSIRQKIALARALQRERYSTLPQNENARLSAEQIRRHCSLAPKAKTILDKAAEKLDFSNRGYLKVIKTAQTITDLDQKSQISEDAILEAIQYRSKLPGA
jgi:magnesium chelatase family protein